MELIQLIQKFRMILSKRQKVRIIGLSILMVFGGLMEIGTVSLVLPFMDAAMNVDTIMEKAYVKWFCTLWGIKSSQGFLIAIAILLAIIYILKNIYLLFEYNIQYYFVYGNMFDMQEKFLNSFIHRPYEYFLNVNSGEAIRIINNVVSTVFDLLSTILILFSETVVSAMLGIVVFIIWPTVTVAMLLVLLSFLLIINCFIKPMLRKAGEDNHTSGIGMNKWLLQSIQGIKELKVMGREGFFVENYRRCGLQHIRSLRKKQIIALVPRYAIEAVSMAAIFLILAVLLYAGGDLIEIIPGVAAVALATVRILPSVNRISIALANISYGAPMLDKLIESLKDVSGDGETSMVAGLMHKDGCRRKGNLLTYEKELDFHEVTYRYPSSEKDVLYNASMNIAAGEFVGIVGESGVGKTTVADIVLGLLRPQKGQVLIDGCDIRGNLGNWLARIGYIPQTIFMLDDTIRANVSFGTPKSEFTDEDIWDALEEAALTEFVKQLPYGLETEIGERGIRLSGGQRQRIGIARALFRKPDVLIFDEATSALDSNTEHAIMESIHRLHGKKTMIIIAHRVTTIEACDHIFRVEDGKITKER